MKLKRTDNIISDIAISRSTIHTAILVKTEKLNVHMQTKVEHNYLSKIRPRSIKGRKVVA